MGQFRGMEERARSHRRLDALTSFFVSLVIYWRAVTAARRWDTTFTTCRSQGCEPKAENRFFRSVFVGFSNQNTTCFRRFLGLKKRRNRKADSVSLGRFSFPCPPPQHSYLYGNTVILYRYATRNTPHSQHAAHNP